MYQLVTNFGITEHVANQFQAMKVIHDLTSPGGLMMHAVPTQGYVMHGMFTYTPKFFQALARSCRYDIHEMIVCSNEANAVLPLDEPEAVLSRYPRIRFRYLLRCAILSTATAKRRSLSWRPFLSPIWTWTSK